MDSGPLGLKFYSLQLNSDFRNSLQFQNLEASLSISLAIISVETGNRPYFGSMRGGEWNGHTPSSSHMPVKPIKNQADRSPNKAWYMSGCSNSVHRSPKGAKAWSAWRDAWRSQDTRGLRRPHTLNKCPNKPVWARNVSLERKIPQDTCHLPAGPNQSHSIMRSSILRNFL